jgi:hypothetical protein
VTAERPPPVSSASTETRQADLFFDTTDGPMQIHFGGGGQVSGQYQQDKSPWRPGRIVGHIGGDGVIEGLWVQAESNQPCGQTREGTYAWGRFIIRRAENGKHYGSWSYCDGVPNKDWQLRPRLNGPTSNGH